MPSEATHQQGDVDHWQSPSQGISMHIPEGSAAGAAAVAGTSKQVSWHAAMAWKCCIDCLGGVDHMQAILVFNKNPGEGSMP